jgi:hypothetical protein
MNSIFASLSVFALAATLANPAFAQHGQHHDRHPMHPADSTHHMHGSMMQGGMMEMHMQMMLQVMSEPLRYSSMMVQVLPTMQEPLGLSDEQAARLRQMEQKFTAEQDAYMEQETQAQQQLQDLLASESADPSRVESQLEESAVRRARMQALAYRTAQQMRNELSSQQQTALLNMTPMQICHHMMTHMTMMDVMQAMHGDMMAGGMMGMMHDGMMHGH